MATCNVCSGYGWTYGNYPSCYSCAGSGRGGFTDIACAACGGSGRGSTKEQLVCVGCGGSGKIPGSERPTSPTSTGAVSREDGRTKQVSKTKPARPAKPWTKNEILALVPAYAVIAWGLHSYLSLTGWWLIGTAIIPTVVIVRAWKAVAVISVAAAALWFYAE